MISRELNSFASGMGSNMTCHIYRMAEQATKTGIASCTGSLAHLTFNENNIWEDSPTGST
jgi:hypothetical protein